MDERGFVKTREGTAMQANTLVKVVKVYDPANDWAVGRYGVVQSGE
jgi:hypothetical protein